VRKRYSEVQIRAFVEEWHAGADERELCRKHGIAYSSLYRWTRASASNKPYKNRKKKHVSHVRGRLAFCERHLLQLQIPPVPQLEEPFEDVSRGVLNAHISVYAFAALAHFREFLQAFLALLDINAIGPAATLACRIVEAAAQCYWVEKRVSRLLRRSDIEGAGRVLSRAVESKGLRRAEYTKAVQNFSRTSGKISLSHYETLARFANGLPASSFAILDAWRHEFTFQGRPKGHGAFHLEGSVLASTVTVLERTCALLLQGNEKQVSSELKKILLELPSGGSSATGTDPRTA
jgi:Transposase